MKIIRAVLWLLALAAAFGIGAMAQKFHLLQPARTEYVTLSEPLLLSADLATKRFHLLPPGTPMYFDQALESHSRYIVYVNVAGPFQSEEVVSNERHLIAPIWGEILDADAVKQLVDAPPFAKDDLVSILKARKTTREEFAQILREWKE